MASAALRSFSRRNLSPKWFCKTSSTTIPPLVLHHDVKDYNTKPTFSDSSLLLARSFHRQVFFFEDRKKMSISQPVGSSSGVFLCRHISSSSSKPAEEWSIKIDALGDTVEGLVPEKSVEAMITTIDGSSSLTEYLNWPVHCAQYVINAIHDFTGLNWSMSVVLTALLASGLMYPVSVHIQRQVWQLKAVYFFLITYKISLQSLHLMCRSKQIAKLSKSLGVPYVPVTAFDQERIMAGLVTIMGEFTDVFIDVLKKKDKK